MFTFILSGDDRLHFASKAIYRSNDLYVVGILVLTDKHLYFGGVSEQFQIDLRLKDISELAAEGPFENWPPDAHKERLRVIANEEHIFALDDSALWNRKIRWRAWHLTPSRS